MVTGMTGACGKMNRTAPSWARSSSRAMGTKSLPSAPNPCRMIRVALGSGPVSISMNSSAAICRVDSSERQAYRLQSGNGSPGASGHCPGQIPTGVLQADPHTDHRGLKGALAYASASEYQQWHRKQGPIGAVGG